MSKQNCLTGLLTDLRFPFVAGASMRQWTMSVCLECLLHVYAAHAIAEMM